MIILKNKSRVLTILVPMLQMGRGACNSFLETGNHQGGLGDPPSVSADLILKALDLCIRNNYFEFNGKIFKQVGGVGTGVKLAPTYACIGMGKFENLMFNSNQDLLDLVVFFGNCILMMFFLYSKEAKMIYKTY